MTVVEFEVIGNPKGKQRAKVTMRGGFARAYTPEMTVSYENLVKLSFANAGHEKMPAGTPLYIAIRAYYPIPASMSQKKRTQAVIGNLRPIVKPDLDNIIKIICDALNGVAYDDDNLIVSLVAKKYYSENPRVHITISSLEEQYE